MDKILISACLVGENVRYDAGNCLIKNPVLAKWQAEGRLVSICPEMAGGLPAPRPPCECLEGRVIDAEGVDYTEAFHEGADKAVALARKYRIKYALLKEQSPSCGVNIIYDGHFQSQKIAGTGVCADKLKQAGLQVFSDLDIENYKKLFPYDGSHNIFPLNHIYKTTLLLLQILGYALFAHSVIVFLFGFAGLCGRDS